MVAVEVANTGNVRLRPSGRGVVTDSAGQEVNRAKVSMESFYTGTATNVE